MDNEQANFSTAKDLYLDGIKVGSKIKSKIKTNQPTESKYARAARLGLCFKCFYEGTKNLHRRPSGKADGFCKECIDKMDIHAENVQIE